MSAEAGRRAMDLLGLLGLAVTLLCLTSCNSGPKTIAVIPRTSGTIVWEPEDVGAEQAAAATGERIYWNASTREDDVDGQIALVQHVIAGNYAGLVLAPDHSLALITPVRRALARGLPIVIVSSPLPIPTDGNLTYVLNDEEEAGRLAANRAAMLAHGHGQVALLGIDPDVAGLVTRSQSLQQTMTASYPGVRIVVRRLGTLNYAHEQEAVEGVLRENPAIDVIIALTSTSMRGAISAIGNSPRASTVKVIGFDPESLPFENRCLDSVIVQNTRAMGERAVRLLHARFRGHPLPPRTVLPPILVTRDNIGSEPMRAMLYARWNPGAARLQRSRTP